MRWTEKRTAENGPGPEGGRTNFMKIMGKWKNGIAVLVLCGMISFPSYGGFCPAGGLRPIEAASPVIVAGQSRENGAGETDGPGVQSGAASMAPYVTDAMCRAEYWIDRYPSAETVLLSPAEIEELNRRIREKPEANVADLAAVPAGFDGAAMVASMVGSEFPVGLYLHGQPVTEDYIAGIRANIGGAAVSEAMELRYGFAVNHTVMKSYPCGDMLSDSPDDPEWDQLASSAVPVNEPLLVYFFSGDGRFAYVRSAICPGWVPAEDIAVCADKAQWLEAQTMDRFLVVTGDKVYLETSTANPESSQKMLAMGTVLELAGPEEEAAAAAVNGRLPWNNYVVMLPVRNGDGSFSRKPALIPVSRDVHVGYLPLTVSGVLKQAFKSLGNRYGWGGSMDAQDCSAFARDVYRCFGLELPRNTTWQAAIPARVTEMGEMDVPGKEAFLRSLAPGTILQFPGHEMIYLGESGGHFYTINDVSTLINPLQAQEDATISRVRSVIVNDLSTRRKNGHTWLEEINRAIEVWGDGDY